GPASRDQIIEQLERCPPGVVCRGIRLPSQPAEPPRPTDPPPGAAAGGTPAQGQPSTSLVVLFATGSATITPEGEVQLAELGQALSDPRLAGYRFLIEGHTDTVGDARANQRLSERRAAAVRTWLIRRHAIAGDRLQAVGRGESDLAMPTPDNTPEVRNRRVRVVNLGG
ncbi:MAG TPA: OmpA family protein, partial [Acetobacteraceae bacterium]|nr:OmpA family protein [Acetobacteraceae bacterium]